MRAKLLVIGLLTLVSGRSFALTCVEWRDGYIGRPGSATERFASGYLEGVAASIRLGEFAQAAKEFAADANIRDVDHYDPTQACIPLGTRSQLIGESAVNWLKQHPERLVGQAQTCLAAALVDVWSCTKKP